jgi:histidine triad (HIT) family protein
MNCLFCNIVAGSIPANVVYEDDQVVAFRDINPQAPTHILIIPKKHISTINDITQEDGPLLAWLIQTAKKLAVDEGLSDEGYRLVFNVNSHGGQAVYHIHLHLLGGRPFSWPPG